MTRSLLLTLPALLIALAGCSNAPIPPAAVPAPATTHDEHTKASARGGVIVEIGQDVAHAEAVFEADGTVRLYLLGKDRSRRSPRRTAAARPRSSSSPRPRNRATPPAGRACSSASCRPRRRARRCR
jgi:hypothetical protein